MKRIVILLWVLLLSTSVYAGEKIKPIKNIDDIRTFVNELQDSGLRLRAESEGDMNFTRDTVADVNDTGKFILEGYHGTGLWLYKADINNDGQPGYIVTKVSGTDFLFDIYGVYAVRKELYENIYDEVKLLMRRIIRDREGAQYSITEGYAGISYGSLDIERLAEGTTYFTIVDPGRHWDSTAFGGRGKYVMDDKSLRYTFLWEKDGFRIVQ